MPSTHPLRKGLGGFVRQRSRDTGGRQLGSKLFRELLVEFDLRVCVLTKFSDHISNLGIIATWFKGLQTGCDLVIMLFAQVGGPLCKARVAELRGRLI